MSISQLKRLITKLPSTSIFPLIILCWLIVNHLEIIFMLRYVCSLILYFSGVEKKNGNKSKCYKALINRKNMWVPHGLGQCKTPSVPMLQGHCYPTGGWARSQARRQDGWTVHWPSHSSDQVRTAWRPKGMMTGGYHKGGKGKHAKRGRARQARAAGAADKSVEAVVLLPEAPEGLAPAPLFMEPLLAPSEDWLLFWLALARAARRPV